MCCVPPTPALPPAASRPGVLSMARGSDRDGATASIFVMLGTAPHLDMEYGAFGYARLAWRLDADSCRLHAAVPA